MANHLCRLGHLSESRLTLNRYTNQLRYGWRFDIDMPVNLQRYRLSQEQRLFTMDIRSR